MQVLERVHLVQFFLFEAKTLELDPTTAIIAPNGAGKSALLDALQIVLLGGDRNRIRFNAQAGGHARARSIRDYCLGRWRSGDQGCKRRTATTYITLVFRDEESGAALSTGLALGATQDEPGHRLYGQYMVPGVALALEDHIEHADGHTLPLAWATFRELITRRCREAGTRPELHTSSERFVKDLLYRLRSSPSAQPDLHAYRKAFQNALNLQRVEDVDLFVRTLVAEDRPTDIARFRALLDTFRQIKEQIDAVVERIATAEEVEARYAKIARQAARSASCNALAAEYQRDLLSEQAALAEAGRDDAETALGKTQRALQQATFEQQAAEEAQAQARASLQGSHGYGDQAQADALAERDRQEIERLKHDLLTQIDRIRRAWQQAGKLDLAATDAEAVRQAGNGWQEWFDELAAVKADAALPWDADTLHDNATGALATCQPLLAALDRHVRALHTEADRQQNALDAAIGNRKRLAAGQSEVAPHVMRLMRELQAEGITATPVCDLVHVNAPDWQPAVEAYLRGNVEALLVAADDELHAVRIYRSLKGERTVHGAKLALTSHALRRPADNPEAGSVAALLDGDNPAAVAFLRRQLAHLECVDSENEVIAASRALTRDGLLAKGGSIERLRLPANGQLKMGGRDNRTRLRLLHEEIETLQRTLQAREPALQQADRCQRALAALADPERVTRTLHGVALEHHQVRRHYQDVLEGREASADPDLLRLSEQLREQTERLEACRKQRDKLLREEATREDACKDAERLLAGLREQEDTAAQQASAAFGDQDVDPQRVETLRTDLDAKFDTIEERMSHVRAQAEQCRARLNRLLPDAWSALAQYARDHDLETGIEADAWREASAFLRDELTRLRDTELANHQTEAEAAYETAVETFRSNVASTLFDNFSKLKYQINTLNRTLRASPAFSNNERYQFHHDVNPEYRDLYRFIQRAAEVGSEDNLFGSAGDVPTAFRELIEDRASQQAMPSPLDDYRRFFRFEVQIRQDDHVIGSLSERMRSGSGGEHRAPLYVIAGAALGAAYGKTEARRGGMGLILLDEFGDKIDAQNARATVEYLRSLGLQLVLATPDTAQGTLSGVLDSYIELFRDADLLQVEHIAIGEAARELLLSDQFDLHPELLTEETERITRQREST